MGDDTGYTDEQWKKVLKEFDEADEALIKVRRAKRDAETAYAAAMAVLTEVRERRDEMIRSDRSSSTAVARRTGLTRTRVQNIRSRE